jgi:hypothetical protein
VSCEDFKGSAHAFREFMRREQDAIERGERMGVSVKWATADPRSGCAGSGCADGLKLASARRAREVTSHEN